MALRSAVVLFYTAGLRRGELVRLTLTDYDPAEQILRINATKFHKSRLVPLSRDAAHEMGIYLCSRRQLPYSADAPLFCSFRKGFRPYSGGGLGRALSKLFRDAGVLTQDGRPPRVHDLRHSFAVSALHRWYREGVDVQAKLPFLATYMGHVSISSTQYYLDFFEPLAEETSARFARHCESFFTRGAP
jgi:integrase